MVYHVFSKFFEKKKQFSVGSSTFLTASCLPIYVSAKSCQTILSIDRSEPQFESHKEGGEWGQGLK